MLKLNELDYAKTRKQSIAEIMKERGVNACFFNALIVIGMFFLNEYVLKKPSDMSTYVVGYLLLTAYATFRPKVIIIIRDLIGAPDPKT